MSEDLAMATKSRPVPRASRVVSPDLLHRSLPVLGVIAVLLLLWEGGKLLLQIPDSRLPHVSAVIAVFGVRTQGGNGPMLLTQMLSNAWATFVVALCGFVLGGALGFALALLFTCARLLERGLMPYVIGSQTVPILAIAPMVVVALGQLHAPEWFAKAIIAAYLTFFPVTIGMLRGLQAASPDALDLMRSYAASPAQVFRKLRLPASLPYLFTSLKVAATASVVGTIVAELPAGSKNGIGIVILNSAQYYNSRPPALYAAVLVAGAVGLCFYWLVAFAERLVVPARMRDEG